MKAAHHRGSYHVRSRRLVAAARSNPDTRCWKCRRTLAELPLHRTGRAPWWTAGHINRAERDGPLAPECSHCGCREGANLVNQSSRTSRQW